MSKLHLDWCSYQAAKYANSQWHYSRNLPAGKRVQVGVWEDGSFIGAIIYAWGANQHLGKAFGLDMTECCELCRVALKHDHQSPVSQMVAKSLKMLKSHSPGLRLVISYADCDQDHHGGIYQAGNWPYLGKVQLNGGTPRYKVHGKVLHGRTVHVRYGRGSQNIDWLQKHIDPKAERVYTKGKHKYAYPLDKAMRRQCEPLTKPYPAGVVINGNTPDDQSGNVGSIPAVRSHPS